VPQGRPGIGVDELARRVGLTVRTLRSYQSAGLIPPPVRRGKAATYGPTHEALLHVIAGLRQQGLGLQAIRHVLERGASGPDIAAYARQLVDSMEASDPVTLNRDDLSALWGAQLTRERLERLVSTAFLHQVDPTSYTSPTRVVMQTGRELAMLGVPLEGAVELTEALHEHLHLLASRYVDLLLRHVAAGASELAQDPARCAAVRASLERLGPLTAAALQAALPLALREQFERALSTVTAAAPSV